MNDQTVSTNPSGLAGEAGGAAHSTRRAWETLALLWVAYAINYLDRQNVFSIFPLLKRELHFTELQLGLIGSVFLWVYSLCLPLAGYLADLWRRDRIILTGLILWSLAAMGTSLSQSITSFLSWRVVMGISESLYVPAALGLIAIVHARRTRSRALGIHSVAQYVGIIVAGWYGGWTAERIGWRPGFFMLGLIGVAYAWVLARGLPEPPRKASGRAKRVSGPFEILRSKCFVVLALAFFAFCMMLWILYGWFPTFIYEHFHLSLTSSGVNATLYLQAATIGGILVGGAVGDMLVARVPAARFYVGAVGLFVCGPFGCLALMGSSLSQARIASALFGFFAGLMIANVFSGAFDVVAQENYSFAAGFLNLVGGLSGGMGLLLSGWWNHTIGLFGLMRWAAVGSACMAVLMIVVGVRVFEKDHRKALAPERLAET